MKILLEDIIKYCVSHQFFDAMKRNREIRIFMINPQAKKIRDDLEPIKDNIKPIEGEFGEEEVFKDLKQNFSEV
jgi:signal-transduction protein with cAMP-binding, CBS, and nucleotidyltransferase domain